jgi:hypothetical protein
VSPWCTERAKAIVGDRYQVGNNTDHINGWIGRNAVFWNCVRVEA